MNICATDFPSSVNELEMAGLTTAPSSLVKVPRIAEAHAALRVQRIHHSWKSARSRIILGRVVAMYIEDRFVDPPTAENPRPLHQSRRTPRHRPHERPRHLCQNPRRLLHRPPASPSRRVAIRRVFFPPLFPKRSRMFKTPRLFPPPPPPPPKTHASQTTANPPVVILDLRCYLSSPESPYSLCLILRKATQYGRSRSPPPAPSSKSNFEPKLFFQSVCRVKRFFPDRAVPSIRCPVRLCYSPLPQSNVKSYFAGESCLICAHHSPNAPEWEDLREKHPTVVLSQLIP